MKSLLALMFAAVFSLFMAAGDACASAKKYATWSDITAEMEVILNQSYQAYFQKDVEKARELVNDAYFGYYEKLGVERAVMSYISGKRGSTVEYQFTIVRNAMAAGKPNVEVRREVDQLVKWLNEDAARLDGREVSKWSIFLASLIIILREGIEAILVIAAIVAYLVRSGNKARTRTVYISSAAAILASVAMAYALQKVFSISGASQEILEGVAMLLAVVVLFFVSNWMVSKSEAEAWKGYIEDKVQTAVTRGSAFALSAAAFLAVFREGAETILFYQALMVDNDGYNNMIWIGFFTGCVILVFVFAIIRFGSLKLPLKPFFIGTSILMYLMCIAFAGGGIKELQEADVVGVTPVPFVQSIDILGIYPTVQTLGLQAILVVLAVVSFIYYRRKSKSVAASAA